MPEYGWSVVDDVVPAAVSLIIFLTARQCCLPCGWHVPLVKHSHGAGRAWLEAEAVVSGVVEYGRKDGSLAVCGEIRIDGESKWPSCLIYQAVIWIGIVVRIVGVKLHASRFDHVLSDEAVDVL